MLRDRIADDLKDAMKARDQVRVATLRMALAAMKNLQVERMHDLSDDEVVEVLAREAKRRRESIEAFASGGRDDLVARESAELAVLEAYLPKALGEDEIRALIEEAVRETGATTPRQMGEVMKALMPKVRGRADGALVSRLVNERLR